MSMDPNDGMLFDAPPGEGFRELIVIARPEAGLRVQGYTVSSSTGADVGALESTLRDAGAVMEPLLAGSEEEARRMSLRGGGDLSLFYRVAAEDAKLDGLAREIAAQAAVETAYVKPAAGLPARYAGLTTRMERPPAVTPDFTARQGYLFAAPAGVDAPFAWSLPGGGGAGVRVVDVEGAWRFGHEDLSENQGGVIGGTERNHPYIRNHGTSVAGILGGDRNGGGVTGIIPDAVVSGCSIYPKGTAWAIRRAADALGPGDVLLLELHRPGPAAGFDDRALTGWIGVEWWPDDYLAIRYATDRGIIVVEAAGNGAQDLDDPIHDVNPAAPNGPFPSWWSNPFRRSPLDSGAIIVGAGAPPPGTHGRDYGPDRSRLGFSSFGACVDAQGWGYEVTTTGWYGDLQGGADEDRWYTDGFAGTSSASPIVAGAVGAVQGILRATGRAPMTPAVARALLRATGSPQEDGIFGPATERIGSRPDLREMVAALGIDTAVAEVTMEIPSAFTAGVLAGAGADREG